MKVLVIKTSSLGDIVHGLRVITSLREQVPDVQVTWVAQEPFAPLVQICAAVDRTIIFRRRSLLRGMSAVLRELKTLEFDAVIDMQGRFLTGLMAGRARARRRIGRTDCREGSGLFYNERVPLPAAGRRSHALDILLEFCGAFGAKIELRGPPVFRAPDQTMMDLAGLPQDRKAVVMFPDSRREEKCWGGFGELTTMVLRENPGCSVVWAGDRLLPFPGGAAFPGRFFNVTGRSKLTDLPALLRQASWVISNDSGPMHLAAALEVKVLGVFGPTDVALYGPYPAGSPTNVAVSAPGGNLRLLGAKEVLYLLKKADPAVFGPRQIAP
jgi:ADP-heptose:LPS heptosyltransferase